MSAVIEVDHVTKEFQLGQMTSLGQSLRNGVRRLRGLPVEQRPPFKALDDVSFSVAAGEVVGIIGHNGAGKSTLLKLLANISQPTRGRVRVHGRIAPLIEVGAGFVPEFTGRENVFLNASILGMTRAEIKRKFDEIVDFAEMAEFIDTPVKRYSSGMQVKLAFAVATSIEAEILIVDEVLAVGDLAFQRKCFDRMEDLIKRQQRTVLLVSHNIRQVERLCSRVTLFDHGRKVADGPARDVCNLFYSQSDEKINLQARQTQAALKSLSAQSSGEIELIGVQFLDASGERVDHLRHDSDCSIVLTYMAKVDIVNVIFGVGVHTTDFIYLADRDTEDDGLVVPKVAAGQFSITCRIGRFPLLPGNYSLRLGVAVGPVYRIAFYAENVHPFQVVGQESARSQGYVRLKTDWQVQVPEPAVMLR